MTVVISSNYVITESISGGGTITADNPVIGYNTLLNSGNVSTTTEDPDYPASNLVNVSTNLRWQGLLSSPEEDEYITLGVAAVDPIDYIGVAKHNWGSAEIAVSVEYLDESASPEEWVELIAPVFLPNDGPVLFRFPLVAHASLRLRLQPGTEAPRAAVVYCGTLLVLQRRIYVGHQPMPYARSTKVVNGKSESGNFLGRIILNQMTQTKVGLQNMTPAWYRTYMEPFVQHAYEAPFFFAWRPQSYPREIGFAWLTNDPMPTNQRQNGMMQVDLAMTGIT